MQSRSKRQKEHFFYPNMKKKLANIKSQCSFTCRKLRSQVKQETFIQGRKSNLPPCHVKTGCKDVLSGDRVLEEAVADTQVGKEVSSIFSQSLKAECDLG
jgi:hypothetical protein